MRKFAVTGVVAGAALAFGSGIAWAASDAAAGSTGPVPATETILSAPAVTKRLYTPAQPVQGEAVQTAQPAQRAGLSKPIKVYWFLAGR